jgi:hypothetical protein
MIQFFKNNKNWRRRRLFVAFSREGSLRHPE